VGREELKLARDEETVRPKLNLIFAGEACLSQDRHGRNDVVSLLTKVTTAGTQAGPVRGEVGCVKDGHADVHFGKLVSAISLPGRRD
jgi:hypothetical protein